MRLAAMLLALAALAPLATHAETWPARPVRWVVPYPPGGSTDILARLVGQKLGERLGQPVVVENKPGAGGNIGTEYVAKQPADGYTILMGNIGPISINPTLYGNLPYQPLRDLAPVTLLMEVPNLLVANPALPVRTVGELTAYAKAKSTLSYATPGAGTSLHLAGELFAHRAQLRLTQVAYKGSAPGLNDTMAGHVPIMFDNMPSALPLVKAGKLRALAITSAQRSAELPDVPTMQEAGVPDYQIAGWFGVLVPAATPAPVVERLNRELQQILRQPHVKQRIAEMGGMTSESGPQAFKAFIQSETLKWSALIQSARITLQQ